MKKLSLRSGLMATTTICGAVLSTMAGGALVATVATMLPAVAQAQDYTSGALVGTVNDANGGPVAGATVTLTSVGQGQARTLTTNTNGQFTATGLQPGDYTVAVVASGYSDYSGSAQIVISQETRFTYELSAVGAEPQTVVVKGKRIRQDFTKTTTGLTVDLDTLVAQQPIGRSLTAVTMLAPTVTKGDPGFGNVASFGGGSVAENAYYINGLNITNPDTYVGSAQVPFDFYKTIEVKTGGYQAEYGRATGGVVNAVSKSGSNNFMFAVHGNFAPDSMRNESLDTQTVKASRYKNSENNLTVETGGAIIKDHLFAYGLASFNDKQIETVSKTAGTYSKLKNDDPFYGLKLDGYITPTQHFELTYFDTTNVDDVIRSSYDADTDTVGDVIVGGGYKAQTGGVNWVGKYTGNVTDWFTISGAYGISEDSDNQIAEDATGYYVRDYTLASTGPRISQNQASTSNFVTDTRREFYRIDGDVRYEFLGRHKLRFGYDHEENSETKTTKLTGGEPVQYQYRNISIDGVEPAQKMLRVIYEVLGGKVSSQNEAMYIQDSWDVTPTLNLQIGARVDNFAQYNLSGVQYLDLDNNFAPRLGFSWTPDVDGAWKVFGSYGSYYIPPAMNLGFRGKDLYFAEHFLAPTGGWVIDPTTGLPASIGDAVAVPRLGYGSACPESTLSSAPGFNSTNAAAGAEACVVYGDGSQEDPKAKAEKSLKATREDEIVLGTNYRVDDLWTLGLTYTHRELKRISEDSDFNDAIIAKLEGMGLDASNFEGGSSYYVWNVGDHDATVLLKELVVGETEQRTLTLTAAELGHYHNPTRDYDAMVFDFKRAFDGKWGLQGSYTWSRSYGNYEGTVKSDVGNVTQDDAGATIAYDSPGFEDYGTGLLANDRTHTLKLWGSYAFTPEFMIGANVLVQSPRHLSCLGIHPTDAYAAGYGAYSHYCNGEPAPLGKGNKTDWTKQIDLSMRYTVPSQFSLGGNLVLRADIFNLFDQHAVLTRQVTYEVNDIGDIDPAYGEALAYSTPRYVRIGFDLSY